MLQKDFCQPTPSFDWCPEVGFKTCWCMQEKDINQPEGTVPCIEASIHLLNRNTTFILFQPILTYQKRHPFFCSFLIEWWVQSFQQDHRIWAKAWKTWKPVCWFMAEYTFMSSYLRLTGWFWQELCSFFNGCRMFFLLSGKLKYQWVHFSFLFDLFLAGHTDFKATDDPTTTILKNKIC